jgi:maleate cis-trans isomerase
MMATMIRARIGVLVPAGNPTVEPEFYRMTPTGVTIHFARLDSGAGAPGTPEAMERRTLGYLDALPDAVRTLADVRPAVIVLAHTGVSYLNGAAGEAALAGRLTELAGTRATTAAGAISAGLRQLGVKRLALATPYPESISAAGRAFWAASGFEIVGYHRLPDVANIYEETEERAYTLGRAADVAAAEAVLISGTGLPTAGIIERLERDLGKPVVTSQQASLWRALRLAGITDAVPGFGRLLREPGADCTSPRRSS